MTIRVLADANVLYSRTLRDWLILLELQSGTGLFKNYWTEDILSEVLYRMRRERPGAPGRYIANVHDKIVNSLEGGRVDDFEIDGSFPGSDPNDQHVHAAAIACGASYVITMDGGFRSASIDPDALPYEVHSPDSFFVLVDDSAPRRVRAVTEEQDKYWSRRPGAKSLADALRDAGCPEFAERVLQHLCQLPP